MNCVPVNVLRMTLPVLLTFKMWNTRPFKVVVSGKVTVIFDTASHTCSTFAFPNREVLVVSVVTPYLTLCNVTLDTVRPVIGTVGVIAVLLTHSLDTPPVTIPILPPLTKNTPVDVSDV